MRRSRCTAAGRTARSPRCRTPTRATTRRCSRWPATCSPRRLRWAGGRGGRPPARLAASFPDGGYFVQRSGWSRRRRFLIFDCGPLGDGGHGHYDLLSVEAFALRPPAASSIPGAARYSEEPPNLRRWFRGTAAHNTVCVDGLDQTPYTPRRGRSGRSPRGASSAARSAPGLDVLAGEARSPVYEAVHRRRIAFVGDRYWIVEDRLRGERAHRYDLRFHLAPAAQGATRVEGATVLAPGLALVILGAGDGRARGRLGRAALRRAARRAGRERASPTAASARFVTLLAPRATGEPRAARDAATRPGRCASRSTARATRSTCATPSACAWERAGLRVSVRAVMTALLAPDPAVPQRDALLDERRWRRCSARACRRHGRRAASATYAKYRVGESLRVVYRSRPAAAPHVAGAHASAGAARAPTARRRRRACRPGRCPACCTRPSSTPCFWTFPNDRRLAGAAAARRPLARRSTGSLGQPVRADPARGLRAERSATAECLDAGGRVIAFAKVHARRRRRARERRGRRPPRPPATRTCACRACSAASRRARRARARAARRPPARRAAGRRARAALRAARRRARHAARALRPLPARRFDRLDPERLARAVAVHRPRPPDAGARRGRAARALLDAARRRRRRRPVCLHGDANLRNALARRRPRRAGRPRGRRRRARPRPTSAACSPGCSPRACRAARRGGEHALAARCSPGTRRSRARRADALRWHTAASVLARVALPAVSRVRAGAPAPPRAAAARRARRSGMSARRCSSTASTRSASAT